MAKCGAGDCEVECSGRGCGCIAESDNPMACRCFCFGGEGPTGGDLTIAPTTHVDVSIHDLTLVDAATFLNGVSATRILIPADRANEPVELELRDVSFGEVLQHLRLAAEEGDERPERAGGLLQLAVGLLVGAVLGGLLARASR